MTRITLILFTLLLFITGHSQTGLWTTSEVYLGDTVNRLDRNGLKQGRWVFLGKDKKGRKYRLYKHNQLVEDGYFVDDKKSKTWKTYYNNGKLKSEVTYSNDEPNGKGRFYDSDGKLIAEGLMQGNDFSGEYAIYDAKGNSFKKRADQKNKIAHLRFTGTVEKFGKGLDKVRISVERNDVEVFQTTNNTDGSFSLNLELNFEYLVTFSKEGFSDQTLEINTNVPMLADTSVYTLDKWKVNLSDNIANTLGSELYSLLLNKPAGKIYFNQRKKRFTTDGAYLNLFTKQFKGISESTKFILAQAADDNKKLEIENLRMEAERKKTEINLLKQAQDLKDAEIQKKEAEILNEKLEREKKEREFEIAQQDKKIKELRFEQQKAELDKKRLEAEKNAKEVERLAILRKVQEYELKEKQKALNTSNEKLTLSRFENEKKAEELAMAAREKEIQDKELKQRLFYMYFLLGGVLLIAVFAFYIFRSYRQKQKANLLLEKQAREISLQKTEIEEKSRLIELKNIETEQSIQYARRIQDAILPPFGEIEEHLKEFFILYKSKDIVSGDFYFFSDKHAASGSVIIASVDCTGHGVPGAFMSMIGNEKLKDAVDMSHEPAHILKHLNLGVKAALRQSGERNATRDGMDLALCRIPLTSEQGKYTVSYAGANRPLWYIKKESGKIEELKATKMAIGGLTEDKQEFEQHELELQAGDSIYLFSDGFADQFGGPKKKKLMTGKFKEIIENIQHLSISEQKKYLNDFIDHWMLDTEQIDDILVIGIRLS